MDMTERSFRRRMQAGEKAIGPILTLPSWQIAEMMAKQEKINFIWIDGEHGMMTPEVVGAMIAASHQHAAPIVRVPETEPWMIKQAMDVGARGIILPMVDTREEAETAARAILYPPEGIRGYGPDFAARSWGVECGDYPAIANDGMLLVIQIESLKGIENASDIASIERVDMLFAGAYDISVALNKIGQITDPEVEAAILSVRDSAHAHGKLAGTIALTPELGQRRLDQGFDFLVTATDQVLLGQAVCGYLNGITVPEPELTAK
jgi:2-keto-3-deoxy-L-rhamnonate aldolase RhmA